MRCQWPLIAAVLILHTSTAIAGPDAPATLTDRVNPLRFLMDSNEQSTNVIIVIDADQTSKDNWSCPYTAKPITGDIAPQIIDGDGYCSTSVSGAGLSDSDCQTGCANEGLLACGGAACPVTPLACRPRRCPSGAWGDPPLPRSGLVMAKQAAKRLIRKIGFHANLGLVVTPRRRSRHLSVADARAADFRIFHAYAPLLSGSPRVPASIYLSLEEMQGGWAKAAWDDSKPGPHTSFVANGISYKLLESATSDPVYSGTITSNASCLYQEPGSRAEHRAPFQGLEYINNGRRVELVGCYWAYLDGAANFDEHAAGFVASDLQFHPSYMGPLIKTASGTVLRQHRYGHSWSPSSSPIQPAPNISLFLPSIAQTFSAQVAMPVAIHSASAATLVANRRDTAGAIMNALNEPNAGGLTPVDGKANGAEAIVASGLIYDIRNAMDANEWCKQNWVVYFPTSLHSLAPWANPSDPTSYNTQVQPLLDGYGGSVSGPFGSVRAAEVFRLAVLPQIASDTPDEATAAAAVAHRINDLGLDGQWDDFSGPTDTSPQGQKDLISTVDQVVERIYGQRLVRLTTGSLSTGNAVASPVADSVSYLSYTYYPGRAGLAYAGEIERRNNLVDRNHPGHVVWRAGENLDRVPWHQRNLWTGSFDISNGKPIRMFAAHQPTTQHLAVFDTQVPESYSANWLVEDSSLFSRITQSARERGGIRVRCISNYGYREFSNPAPSAQVNAYLSASSWVRCIANQGQLIDPLASTSQGFFIMQYRPYVADININGSSGAPFWGTHGLRDVWPAHLPDGTPIAADPTFTPQTDGELAAFISWLAGEGQVAKLHSTMLSTPAIVGPPPSYPHLQDHNIFSAAHQNRREVVYVASNLGFLHAFDSATGDEMFAYMPAEILPTIYQFYRSYRGVQHPDPRRFAWQMNGSLRVEDIPQCNGQTCAWRTVGVLNYGIAREGFVSLDITDPLVCAAGICRARGSEGEDDVPFRIEFNLYSKQTMPTASSGQYPFGEIRNHMGTNESVPAIVFRDVGGSPDADVLFGAGYPGSGVTDSAFYTTFLGQGGDLWTSVSYYDLPDPANTHTPYAVLANPVAPSDQTNGLIAGSIQVDLAGRAMWFPGGTGQSALAHDIFDPTDDNGAPAASPRIDHPLYLPPAVNQQNGVTVLTTASHYYYELDTSLDAMPSRVSFRGIQQDASVDVRFTFDCDVTDLCNCLGAPSLSACGPLGGAPGLPVDAKPVATPLLYHNTNTNTLDGFYLYYEPAKQLTPPASLADCKTVGTTYFFQLAMPVTGGVPSLVRIAKYENTFSTGLRFILGGSSLVMTRSGAAQGVYGSQEVDQVVIATAGQATAHKRMQEEGILYQN